ncbi:KTSC domain-containing protein [Afipia carboxidovorans]|uniref:KTSC domain-containing protein n=1 Tax=Afipia carboxidovorans TaxID=40137 RepID=UPI00308F3D49|nr:KTSC domain-containing protein [Afipia carboxidovorans]
MSSTNRQDQHRVYSSAGDPLTTIRSLAAIITLLLGASFVEAETVEVKYRGPVDLKPFICQDITRSSFVNRVCYDKPNRYMLIQLRATYYHYCEIPDRTVAQLLNAPSMGKFYNANIKGSGSDGPYDCRSHRVPVYK